MPKSRKANVEESSPGAVTKAEFAARVGLTRGRISQLIADGLPVRPDGRIDFEAGCTWLENSLDPDRRAASRASTRTAARREKLQSVADVRRRLMTVQVQRARLAYARERARLVDAHAARATIVARARAERDAHMAWVHRAAAAVAAELDTDPRATFEVLDRLMREHLEHLANTPLPEILNADTSR